MQKAAGFTLIEIVVTMIIVGIMASVAGLGILSGVRGYVFAKNNSAISEKAQLAMTRMNRTFIEVLDITTVGASPTRVTYNRLSGGVNTQETLYLDTSDNSVKLAAGGSTSGGDTLVDNVNSLTLTYRTGSSAWNVGDPFENLSSVEINLVMARDDGGNNVTFSSVVSPRNNGNRGGSTSTTMPPTTGCFVATAAFGQPDHPIVLILKEFRDRRLSTWLGGQVIVKTYYACGPYLADLIRGNHWACILTQILLLPFAGMAFLVLYAPQVIPVFIVLACLITALFSKLVRGKQKKFHFSPSGHGGSALLGLIGTIVVFSLLGAAMLSMTTSSSYSQMGGSSATRAYYLAEAGMRYAASQFRNASGEDAKDAILEYIHSRDYALSSDGTFHLEVYPYYFKTTVDPNGTNTLPTKFPGGVPADMSIPTSGYLKLRTESTPRQYTGRTVSGTTVTFTMASTLTMTTNSNVLPVGQHQASDQSLSKDGNLTLATGAGFFPALNGTFTIGTALSTTGSSTAVYSYKRRSGNVLYGIRLSQTPSTSFTITVPASAFITSMKFVNLQSRGTFGQGTLFQSSRTISYSIPIGWVTVAGSTEKAKFTDRFDDLSHWFSSEDLGEHSIASVGGNNAMKVTGTYSPWWDLFGLFERESIITLNWGSTGVDLNQSWAVAGNLLSYDAQVKIRVRTSSNGNVDYYMPGIIFRIDESGRMYGVSFLRPNPGSGFLDPEKDKVPDDLCPTNTSGNYITSPMIVLWQEAPADTVRWLAYKILTYDSGNGILSDTAGKYLADWDTLVVRVIEADSLSFTQNGGTTPLAYGDTITGASSGATAVINGTPILTSGTSWSAGNAQGVLTVSAATKNTGGVIQFQSGEALRVNGVTRATYTGTCRYKDNYIRVYYGKDAASLVASSIATDNGRKRHQRSAELQWPKDNITDWAADNDYFTLVQWDTNINTSAGGGLTLMGSGSEPNAIIRTNTLVTPSSGTFTRPEVGLDTWGSSSTNVYFDDFGLAAPAPGQTQGFLPGIQQ